MSDNSSRRWRTVRVFFLHGILFCISSARNGITRNSERTFPSAELEKWLHCAEKLIKLEEMSFNADLALGLVILHQLQNQEGIFDHFIFSFICVICRMFWKFWLIDDLGRNCGITVNLITKLSTFSIYILSLFINILAQKKGGKLSHHPSPLHKSENCNAAPAHRHFQCISRHYTDTHTNPHTCM